MILFVLVNTLIDASKVPTSLHIFLSLSSRDLRKVSEKKTNSLLLLGGPSIYLFSLERTITRFVSSFLLRASIRFRRNCSPSRQAFISWITSASLLDRISVHSVRPYFCGLQRSPTFQLFFVRTEICEKVDFETVLGRTRYYWTMQSFVASTFILRKIELFGPIEPDPNERTVFTIHFTFVYRWILGYLV